MPVGAIMGAATLGGAALSSRSADRQTQAQQQTTNTNNALQQQIFNQQRADLAPWRASGGAALAEINRRLGLGGSGAQVGGGAQINPGAGPGVGVGGAPIGSGGNLQARFDRQDYGMGDTPGLTQPMIQSAIGTGGAQINPGIVDMKALDTTQPQINPGAQMSGTTGGAQINPGPGGGTAPVPTGDPENRYGGFYQSPGYQFRMDEGTRSINANRAASGMLQSGDTLKALTRYGQDYASNEFNTQLNQLFSVAGLGQTATGQGNALAGQYGAQVSQNNQNASNALQSSYGTQANTWGNALGQLGGYAAYAWPQQQTGGGAIGGALNNYRGMLN